ncbi:Serine hydrolase FSH [Penicillium roqueforti FM164]|uniref:Serine hydrolase FSH n=1 Tax=Penicillium roqueforti (strain FM164) TaxID=1365484 RepID=W6QCF9_PENRF|nr:Serine hydrolase FSH [Penicillium roqueforti FM164]
MKWLCIHGTGSSATIFQDQLAAVTAHLPPSKHAFHFIDGPFTSKPAAGLDLRYPDGPYYTWWLKATVSDIRAACQDFHKYLTQHNNVPYDGMVCFSRGCLLIASYIWFHQIEKPTEPLPFKAVVFICGGPVLSVLETLGMTISDEAREWDKRTKLALRERASKEAILKWGRDRWTTPGGNGDTDLHLNPAAPVDPSDIFGLDTVQMPEQLRIKIPTLHVYGRVDPRLPASLQLAYLSESTKRLTYQHEGGHNIPRSAAATEGIARLIDECAQMVAGLDVQ